MTRERYDELCGMNKKQFMSFSTDPNNDKEMQSYYSFWDRLLDSERVSVDLMVGKTSDQIIDEQRALIENPLSSYNNGQLTPAAVKINDALDELLAETRLYESAVQMMKTAGKGDLVLEIQDLYATPIEYAKCGCCVEKGGHTIVTLKNGQRFEFSYYGTLIEESHSKFKWLRFGK